MIDCKLALVTTALTGMLAIPALGDVTLLSSHREAVAGWMRDIGNPKFNIDEHDEVESDQYGQFDATAVALENTASIISYVGADRIEGEFAVDGEDFWSNDGFTSRTTNVTLNVEFSAAEGTPYRLMYSSSDPNNEYALTCRLVSDGQNVFDVNTVPSNPPLLEGYLEEGEHQLYVYLSHQENIGGGFITTTPGDFAFTLYLTGQPPVCPGDLNADGVIDTADLGGLIAAFGSTTPAFGLGDINGDTMVDTADLGVLVANFGSTCP